MTAAAPGALDGVRVVEIAGVVLGPYAGQLLGDLGADVIKLEPLEGDSMRAVGPAGQGAGMGSLYLGCNRNKRSLAIDLKHPDGLGATLRLLEGADVLLHNYRPESIARMGLGYAAVRAVNPRIIHCAMHGYGSDGPYGGRGAYDDSVQAASGLAALQARAGAGMRFVPTIVADKTTALFAVQAVLAALLHRERHGAGQEIEVPMFETMTGWLAVEHLWGLSWEPPRGGSGYPRVLSPDRRPYRARDGVYLSVLPYMDRHWTVFWEAAGHAEVRDAPRFASVALRLANIDACYAAIAAAVAERDSGEWLSLLGESCVPITRVNDLDELVEDPHLLATGFWEQHTHPTEGGLRMPRPACRFSESPAGIRRLPPRLGEHSREVLREAGLDATAIQHLVDGGVIAEPAS